MICKNNKFAIICSFLQVTLETFGLYRYPSWITKKIILSEYQDEFSILYVFRKQNASRLFESLTKKCNRLKNVSV